jgi:hypothetical protein
LQACKKQEKIRKQEKKQEKRKINAMIRQKTGF